MRGLFRVPAVAALLVLSACSGQTDSPARPVALTEDAIGRYCGMNVLEHAGPKGQILLSSALQPVWFSSARDAIAFTLLPEEPKDIRAVYVSDMAKAESWETPGAANWVEARDAWFVIDSSRTGGMGTAETVPFSSVESARAFARQYGGRVVRFGEIPKSYVLPDAGGSATSADDGGPE